MNREDLIKDRSVARCIVEGYRLFNAQKAVMFRCIWKPLVGTSLGLAMMLVLLLNRYLLGVAIAMLPTMMALFVLKRNTFRLIAPFPKVSIAFKRMIRHLGDYLTFALLSGIVCLVIFTLLFLPASILLAAGHVDHALVLQGDGESLGVSYWLLTLITLSICFAVILFIQTWQTFGAVYLYGAMVARDSFKANIQSNAKAAPTLSKGKQ